MPKPTDAAQDVVTWTGGAACLLLGDAKGLPGEEKAAAVSWHCSFPLGEQSSD